MIINIATEVVGEIATRLGQLETDAAAIARVGSTSFPGAPEVQSGYDTLIDQIGANGVEMETNLEDLVAGLQTIHGAFLDVDRALAASWDLGGL